jgi:hypothetical protein
LKNKLTNIFYHIKIYFYFFSSGCSLTRWEEIDQFEKHETTHGTYSTWVEEAFVTSFLDWVRNKIVSRIPDQRRTAYEMHIPQSHLRGETHIDVILHKGFPLPAYAPRKSIFFHFNAFNFQHFDYIYVLVLSFQNLICRSHKSCVLQTSNILKVCEKFFHFYSNTKTSLFLEPI